MYKGNQAQQVQDNIPQQRGNKNKISLSYQRMLVHFKNCLHDGYFNQIFKREGPGITILDNGSVVIGNFKNDQNIGVCLIFITTDTYFIGQFNKGVLDGSFVIRSPDTTIYSSFTNNKIQGELLLIDYQNWAAYLWSIQNNGQGEIIKQMSLGEIMNSYMSYEQIKRIQKNISSKLDKTKFIPQQSLIIKAMAPYIQIIPNISQFIKSAKTGSNQFQGMGPQIFSHKIFQNNQILLLNSNNVNEFLGVVLNKKQELIAFGQFKQFQFEKISAKDKLLTYEYTYILNGIGTKIENLQNQSKKNRVQETTKVIYSGQFIKHQLNGQGCKYVVGQKSIYGKFVDGNLRHADVIKINEEKDEEIKRLQLKRLKNIHIHSLKFQNNYSNERTIFILQNLFQMMKPSHQNKSEEI